MDGRMFCEEQVLERLLAVLHRQNEQKEVVISIIQAMGMLLLNLSHPTSISTGLSLF